MNLLELATRIAKARHGGHFTLMKFTTNYRFCFGTVAWSIDLEEWYKNVAAMYVGDTLDEAIARAIVGELTVPGSNS